MTAPAVSCAIFACFHCLAQTPAVSPPVKAPAAGGPSFEVASIRLIAGGVRPEIQTSPGSLTIRNESLLDIIYWAYDKPPFLVSAPAWAGENRFDIVAKADAKSTAQAAANGAGGDQAQTRLMLQRLLADRFGLTTHVEQKETQVYTMTLAKGGPKFQASTTDGPPVFDRGGPTTLTAHRVTMKDLAAQISEPLKRPVIDETGLTGRYELKIDVSGYVQTAAGADVKGPGEGKGGPDGPMDVMSILFTGLQEQLGVKLNSKKENVDILVIDHAEKTPTEN